MVARIRLLLHLMALIVAAVAFWLLPFSPVVNAALAGAFWIADGVVAEMVFRSLASREEQIADLRDRVDNPPS